MRIRQIEAKDDAAMGRIIREILQAHDLARPGTAYCDPQLNYLSRFYAAKSRRQYFVAVDDDDTVIGGAGFAEFDEAANVAELQKLYIVPEKRGTGICSQLLKLVEDGAVAAGYDELYLETHHNLAKATAVYEAKGFTRLAGPRSGSEHQTMDLFFAKQLKKSIK